MSRPTKARHRRTGRSSAAKPRPKKQSSRRSALRRSPPLPEIPAILEAARRELSRRGYQRASFREISKALGCRVSAIEARYPTKEALGLALLEWRAGQSLKALPESDQIPSARERLGEVLLQLIRFYLEDRGLVAKLMLELWRTTGKDSAARLRLSWTHAQWQALLQEILEAGIKTGELRAGLDAETAAASLAAACEGMALRYSVMGGATPPEAFRDALLTLLDSGQR